MGQAPERGRASPDEFEDRYRCERARAKRALERARVAQRRLRLLTEATEILTSSLDYQVVLTNLAKLTVARYADWCLVHLYEEDGRLHRLALEHCDPQKVAEAKSWLEQAKGLGVDAVCLEKVISAQKPWIYNVTDAEEIPDVPGAREALELMKRAGITSVIIVPLTTGTTVLGALTLARTEETAHPYTERDLVLAMDLARRASVAIDNARLHRQVKNSLSSLNIALAAGQMGIWEWRVDLEKLTWSPQFDLVHGAGTGAFEDSTDALVQRIHPDDLKAMVCRIKEATEQGNPFEVEYRLRPDGGSIRWIHVRGSVVERDRLNRPVRFTGTWTDVTARKQVETALKEANEKLRAVIQASPLPIIAMDAEGRVTEWNEAAEHLLGWSKDEVIGRPNPMIPSVDEGEEPLLERMRRGEHLTGVLVKRMRRDGSFIDLSKWTTPILGPDQEVAGTVAIYMDVTDRTRFLRVASHELGNPLASIKALCSLLRLYATMGKPVDALTVHIDRLHREVDRFSELLGEIFEVFRSQQGQLPYEFERVEATQLLSRFIEGFRPIAPTHDVTFEAANEERAWIRADSRRLEQLISNLLLNAVRYSPDGGEIKVRVECLPESVRISVSDQGVGIPKQEFPRLFEEFYRVEGTREHHQSGMGLGLYICREIALQHGGRIWVESDVGVGSTFFVDLPREK